MKNSMRTLLLAITLLATPLVAGSTQMNAKDIVIEEVEQYPFLGIVGSYDSDLENSMILGFRFGMQNNLWRTSFTYEDNFDEYKAFIIQVDRTVVAGLFDGRGRIYLGASGGWVDGGDDVLNSFDINSEESISSNGYTIGINMGLMYYISDQLDLSLDYRYLDVDDVKNIENISGLSLSLHYFF